MPVTSPRAHPVRQWRSGAERKPVERGADAQVLLGDGADRLLRHRSPSIRPPRSRGQALRHRWGTQGSDPRLPSAYTAPSSLRRKAPSPRGEVSQVSASRFSAETRGAVIARVAAGCSFADAARASGISPATLKVWMYRGRSETDTPHAEFAATIEAVRETKAKRKAARMTEDQFPRPARRGRQNPRVGKSDGALAAQKRERERARRHRRDRARRTGEIGARSRPVDECSHAAAAIGAGR